MKTLLFFLSFLLFIACISQQSPTDTTNLRVNHYQHTAIGTFPQLVLLVQEDEEIGGDSWNYFYEKIDGFDYEQGFIYDLKVEKTYLENPPQDASVVSYILMNITRKEKVSDESNFEVILNLGYDDKDSDSFVTGNQHLGFKILDEITIDCNVLCAQLDEALQSHKSIIGIFRHQGEEEIYLLDINNLN